MKNLAMPCLALWLSACSTLTKRDIATRDDYAAALHEFKRGSIENARALFPAKEAGSFITSIETYWLDLLSGRPADPKALLAIADRLEDRQTVRISAELGSLFYQENTGLYYPAEHEAVILHLVLATGFLKDKKYDAARVELRRAARYLQSQYAPNREPFDDPALRVWLASLWMAAGEWSSALVDLRVAQHLAPNIPWLQALAQRETPPGALQLVFAGAGPSLSWEPFSGTAPNPLASLKFHPSVAPVSLQLVDGKASLAFPPALPTLAWFDHHQKKNAALYELIQGSRYLSEGVGSATASSANYIGATLVAGFTLLAGVGGGIAIAASVGGDAGAAAGSALIVTGYLASKNLYQEGERRSRKWLEEGLGELEYYRFVRFLPDFIYLLPTDHSSPGMHVSFARGSRLPFLQLQSPDGHSLLNLYQANMPPTADLKMVEVPAHLSQQSWGTPLLHREHAWYAEAERICHSFTFDERQAELVIGEERAQIRIDAFTEMLYPKDVVQAFKEAKHKQLQVICKIDRTLSPEISLFERKLRNRPEGP